MKKNLIFLPVLMVALFGCATPKMTNVSDTMALKEAPQIILPDIKPEPPQQEEVPQAKDKGLFSLSVRDAEVRDVFLLLSKDSGVNIIADSDVSGKISIDFTGLDLNSALYAITRQMGYTFKMENGFVRISRAQMATKTFYVNYVKDIREAKSTTNIAGFSGGSTSGASGTGGVISGSGSDGQGMNVSLTTQSTSDFWTALEDALQIIIFGNVDNQNILKSKSGFSRGDAEKKELRETKEKSKVAVKGQVEKETEVSREVGLEGEGQQVRYRAFELKSERKLIVNELAGIIQVTDYIDNIPNIEAFLADIEKAVRKQVMIQAHIVEVTLNDGFRFGIDWDTLLKLPGNLDITLSQNLRVPLPTGTEPVFQLDFKHRKVDGILEAMKEQGQVNVLSSPKISTMNNQRAVIKLTTKEVSWVTSTYITQGVVVSNTTPQIDEVGLFLNVTPQIDNNGIITMQIHPSISEKLTDSTSPDGKSTKPVINVREVDTMIKVKNGQTIVIAGLITDKINDTTKRVPLLGDIPIIGAAFKQVVQEKKKSELVILITPYVLSDQSIEDIRKEHEERLRKAGRTFEPVPVIKRSE